MSDHEPCPVCGAQPKYFEWHGFFSCDHGSDGEKGGALDGPMGDRDGSKWDAQMRAIRTRALAEVRAKVEGLAVGEQDDGCHSGAYLHRDDVLAHLRGREMKLILRSNGGYDFIGPLPRSWTAEINGEYHGEENAILWYWRITGHGQEMTTEENSDYKTRHGAMRGLKKIFTALGWGVTEIEFITEDAK